MPLKISRLRGEGLLPMEGAELPDNALGQSRSGVNFARGGGEGRAVLRRTGVAMDWHPLL